MRSQKNKEKLREENEQILSTSADSVSPEDVYRFYSEVLIPSLLSSLPILLGRVGNDVSSLAYATWRRIVTFLIPWSKHDSGSLSSLWNQTVRGIAHPNSNHSAFVDFVLRHFDTNNDGVITVHEIAQMKEKLSEHLPEIYRSGVHFDWSWWHAWPMIDWKIGVFLWRTCGGFLIVFAILTIVPGKIHGYSGKILRWPILGTTYVMITTELIVYAIIRLFIRFVETMVATSKHRMLRWKMTQATSYEQWYQITRQLDTSQGRNQWIESTADETSNSYNWSFIKDLMSELRTARKSNDSIMALAVLQQCTRNNVAGIMSYEMFSFTNSGEPKNIVKEFITEVEETLKWVTNQAKNISIYNENDNLNKTDRENDSYREKLHAKTTEEKQKVLRSMMSWATLNVLRRNNQIDDANDHHEIKSNVSSSVRSCSESTSLNGKEKKLLPPIHREKVKIFLKRAKAAYGRTCLCLSGGAMMGCYHFGVVLALFEQNALPHIISGTSAGSVIAAMICTRTDDEIRRDLKPEIVTPKMTVFQTSWSNRLKNVYREGCLFDNKDWRELLKWFTFGNMTFEEAYRKSGRLLCITISSTTKKAPPIVMNYVSSPDVVIASAIMASAAVPGFIRPVRLEVKDADGNIRYQAENKDEVYWDGSIEQDIPITSLSELFNCQFVIASQCNPHIVPFFYSSQGDVGRPSRWKSDSHQVAWRGGFLLSALELYLKSDMRAKFQFLKDIDVALGFTSTLMTQQFHGTTTIVPQVHFMDFFKIIKDATYDEMKHYFQGGSVAAYHHIVMIKLHYRIAHTLDECLAILENNQSRVPVDKEKRSEKRTQDNDFFVKLEIHPNSNENDSNTRAESVSTYLSEADDEYAEGSFALGSESFRVKKN